jgi:hypothetical protein
VLHATEALHDFAVTLRRRVIDIAAKIICHAGRTVLKIPQATWEFLHFQDLWNRSAQPPQYLNGCKYHPTQWGNSLNLGKMK